MSVLAAHSEFVFGLLVDLKSGFLFSMTKHVNVGLIYASATPLRHKNSTVINGS